MRGDMDIPAEKIKFLEFLKEEIRGTFTDEDAQFLADKMIGAPDLAHSYTVELMDAMAALRTVESFEFLHNGRLGWLDRNGKLWSCAYASHERMCRYFDWDERVLENAGWIRISGNHKNKTPNYLYRPSLKQLRYLDTHGIVSRIVDDILGFPPIKFNPLTTV